MSRKNLNNEEIKFLYENYPIYENDNIGLKRKYDKFIKIKEKALISKSNFVKSNFYYETKNPESIKDPDLTTVSR